ncbi:uncharacterized protein LOC128200996 [Galleria mellonella]|uniref:Uncharacterized protein LOC128200996 n=1 Tax=Galleria mellonella TaxID=7137 RepID=A0ABM3MM03_GALME|nr:uncharacterized protein LOC128200996 [Galleria mellonella]
MERAITPESKRRVRATLDEISARLDRLHSEVLVPLLNARDRRSTSTPSHQSRASSPRNETVNQQRGRECLHISRSPENELTRNSTTVDDVEIFGWTSPLPPPSTNSVCFSPPTSTATSESSPRKRVRSESIDSDWTSEGTDFSDTSESQDISTNWQIDSTPPNKKPRLEKAIKYNGPLDVALKDLRPNQLIDIIKSVMDKHPDIEDEVRTNMPAPDLLPLEERFFHLRWNIVKLLSTPGMNFEYGSLAYFYARSHLEAFNKYLVEQGKVLLDSQQWKSVIEYVLLAWKYVRAISICDRHIHIPYRALCFERLSAFCMTALEKGYFDRDLLIDTQYELQRMIVDCEDIESCIEKIEEELSYL